MKKKINDKRKRIMVCYDEINKVNLVIVSKEAITVQFEGWMSVEEFLVADTRLYKPLRRSVGRSVGP